MSEEDILPLRSETAYQYISMLEQIKDYAVGWRFILDVILLCLPLEYMHPSPIWDSRCSSLEILPVPEQLERHEWQEP